jgi:hypothetical protein
LALRTYWSPRVTSKDPNHKEIRMEAKQKDHGSGGAHGKVLVVTIHDEDDGNVIKIEGRPDDRVKNIVDELYRDHLNRERRENDRLRCEENGEDVFAHLEKHLRAYEATECRHLVWLFCGDQGGA